MPQNYLEPPEAILAQLRPDCEKCFGLCCVALCFSVGDGFPADKPAGTPCPHLSEDFRCAIHDRLGAEGCGGCIAFDCLGAGQRVSQVTFEGRSWRQEASEEMFAAFLVMRQLHELSWYFAQALTYESESPLCERIKSALGDVLHEAMSPPQALKAINFTAHYAKAGGLLRDVSGQRRAELARGLKIKLPPERARADYAGRDLRSHSLRCAGLRGACLIAANLMDMDLTGTDLCGADLRDANLSGADLSGSLFLTQPQLGAARGDSGTKLPPFLTRPVQWV